MNDNIKKFLNEDQDPKAIEKISNKLNDLLMRGEEVGYIGVQKKPVTVLPDSIVLTNKRIIICKPKNLGLSMDFLDYDWNDISATFIKENILGSEFSFLTKSDLTFSIDYIPKTQARRIATFAKEQLELLKTNVPNNIVYTNDEVVYSSEKQEEILETPTEEVTNLAEIMPLENNYQTEIVPETKVENTTFTQEELFEKLQNYKKLLDNGLILQGEYDAYKKEILSLM